jgi:cytochrome P450 family 142 subfamily A polypeptide 1
MDAAQKGTAPADLDYGKSDFWTWDSAMYDHLRWLRENDPIHWSEASGFYVISKFQDLSYISKNNHIFCSGQGVLPGNPAKLGFIDEDEPRHGQLRKLINKGFTPRMTELLEVAFDRIVTEVLDEVTSKGECDFVDDIAVPLPLLIIAEMIGIRREDRDRFHHWSDTMIGAQGNMHDPAYAERASQSFGEYAVYVNEIIEDRRKNPKDDLISILVGAKDDGLLTQYDNSAAAAQMNVERDDEIQALNNDELTMFCVLLMVAGNETTRNALSGGLKILLENPEAKQRVIDDPELIPQAAEEMLRLTSPIISFIRTATEDHEVNGVTIKKGEKVLLVYPSANRDADEFKDPDSFDLDRNPHHVAFGVGNHFCLGANLARMELRVAYRELFRRIPDLELVGTPQMQPSALVRSCSQMNVKFTPEAQ